MESQPYAVYIMANPSETLYTGMTVNLAKRMREHRDHAFEKGFTARYFIHRLVYYEFAESKEAALFRERQIKAWSRKKKIALINSFNPTWEDLTDRIQRLT